MLKLKTLKKELLKNERALSAALDIGDLSTIYNLKTQRDLLKTMIIEMQEELLRELTGVA